MPITVMCGRCWGRCVSRWGWIPIRWRRMGGRGISRRSVMSGWVAPPPAGAPDERARRDEVCRDRARGDEARRDERGQQMTTALNRIDAPRTKVGLVAGGLGAYWPQFP